MMGRGGGLLCSVPIETHTRIDEKRAKKPLSEEASLTCSPQPFPVWQRRGRLPLKPPDSLGGGASASAAMLLVERVSLAVEEAVHATEEDTACIPSVCCWRRAHVMALCISHDLEGVSGGRVGRDPGSSEPRAGI